MTIDAVLFDMDGLLVDTENLATEILCEIMIKKGVNILALELEKYIYGKILAESFKELVCDYKLPILSEQLLYEHRNVYNAKLQNVNVLPSACNIVKLAKAKYDKTALVSGSTKEQVEIILSILQVKSDFDVILTCNDISEGKPNPKSYLLAAQKLNVDIKQCIVLEDATAGIEAANKAGTYSIGVRIGSKGRQDLSKANYVVEFLKDIDWEYVEEDMKNRMAFCKV